MRIYIERYSSARRRRAYGRLEFNRNVVRGRITADIIYPWTLVVALSRGFSALAEGGVRLILA